MWNVEERFSPKAIEGLAALGFAVGSTRGVVRVEKYGCGAEFRKSAGERYQMTVMPTIMLKGQFTRLLDAGYQKFLLTDDGLKIPALASHPQNLRKFNEELRTALGRQPFWRSAAGAACTPASPHASAGVRWLLPASGSAADALLRTAPGNFRS